MNPYRFEAHEPPAITELQLINELKRRELRRQTRLLRLCAILQFLLLVTFAVFILRDSLLVSIASAVLAGVVLAGGGVISVVFFRRGAGIAER